MTFFENVASMEERALSEIGVKILHIIADRKKKHLDTRLRDIDRVMGSRTASGRRPDIAALANAGFIEHYGWDVGSGMDYNLKLTKKGWDFVGNKPIWL